MFHRFIKENFDNHSEEPETEPILSGKVLATAVLSALNKYCLTLTTCVGIGTDGCNVMLGEEKGVVSDLNKL